MHETDRGSTAGAVERVKDDRSFVIDLSGNLIIEPNYDNIEHYRDDLFFVQKGVQWAVFKKGEIYIDFQHLNTYDEDELYVDMRRLHSSHEKALILLIKEKKRALRSKMNELSLKAYIELFEPFRSQTDLQEAGLWGKEVSVKEGERISGYKHLLKDHTKGTIGWSYPVTAGMFEMSVEIPVVFDKVDGDEISLGIPLELVELRR